MANEKNLIPLSKRTQRERKEIARKGAQAANKKKREQKTYAEMAKAMLSAKITDENLLEEMRVYGINDTDVKAYTLLGMIKASGGGSYNAFDRLMRLIGEDKLEQENEVSKVEQLLMEMKPNAKNVMD